MTVDLPPPSLDASADHHDHSALTAPPISPSAPDGIRPGDLTTVWRLVVLLGWIAAFFAYAAVWQASVQLGIATWWVGPRSQPQPTLIRMIPFFLTIAAGMFAVYNARRLSHVSLAFSALSILIALPDFSRSTGLAVVELLISGALIVLSLASLTGRYRLTLGTPTPLSADAAASQIDAMWADRAPVPPSGSDSI